MLYRTKNKKGRLKLFPSFFPLILSREPNGALSSVFRSFSEWIVTLSFLSDGQI